MKIENRINYISKWISDYSKKLPQQPSTLVVGVSGGIDSAVTSTLCAQTGIKTIVVSMPIKQNQEQHSLSITHIEWLKSKYNNVISYIINLDNVFTIRDSI